MNNKFAILILSCDKYSDLWPVTIGLLKKNLPQGNYNIYLASNKISCLNPAVISILSGHDVDWSSSYLSILEQIPEDKLFVILEDVLISSPIEANRFSSCIQFLFEEKASHLKYWPSPRPDFLIGGGFSSYFPGAPYRVTVNGFWDRKVLTSLLLPGENPWQFEMQASYRSIYKEGFYTVDKPLFDFINMIEKGCWIPSSVKKLGNLNIDLDLSKRPILQGSSLVKSIAKRIYFNLILLIPWGFRVKLLSILKKAFISY